MMTKIEKAIKALECCQDERQCDICPYNSHGADDCDNFLLFDVARLLKQQRVVALPIVDAVPVVRCKDCRYAHMTYNGECKYCDFWQEDGGDALYLDGDFYCAAGERKDGDDDDTRQ